MRGFLIHLSLAVALTTGCSAPVESLYPAPNKGPACTVYVVNHGRHTGLVVARADFVKTSGVAFDGFGNADYLEFGWGDAAYYPAKRPTVWLALKALFWPTPSVLHVVGLQGDLRRSFPDQEIVQIRLSQQGFEQMRGHIDRTFARSKDGQVIAAGPGLYGDSEFYQARGKFYFPKMCNNWTATALRSAGCPISPVRSITAGCVMSQTQAFGEVIQSK